MIIGSRPPAVTFHHTHPKAPNEKEEMGVSQVHLEHSCCPLLRKKHKSIQLDGQLAQVSSVNPEMALGGMDWCYGCIHVPGGETEAH